MANILDLKISLLSDSSQNTFFWRVLFVNNSRGSEDTKFAEVYLVTLSCASGVALKKSRIKNYLKASILVGASQDLFASKNWW